MNHLVLLLLLLSLLATATSATSATPHLPQVHEMVRDIFKKEPNRSMNPDEVCSSSIAVQQHCCSSACRPTQACGKFVDSTLRCDARCFLKPSPRPAPP